MKAKLLLLAACILISLLFFTFTLCSTDDGLTEGIVYQKEFREAGTRHRTEKTTQTHTRKSGNIVVESHNSFEAKYPDRWVIFIRSEDGKDSAEFYVHEPIYDDVAIGSHFKFETTKGQWNEPYERIKNE